MRLMCGMTGDGTAGVDPVRSRIMAAIRGKDTKPEMAVRRHLHAAGLRFSLHRRDLPGRPDVVLARHRAVVFVHGCFWHGHGCRGARPPATRSEWWAAKIARNRERDVAAAAALRRAGWRVLVVWECDLRRPGHLDELAAAVRGGWPFPFLGETRPATARVRARPVPAKAPGPPAFTFP